MAKEAKQAKHGLPLGIDVGGSGIKGAPVDLDKGAFAAKRMRIDTPVTSTPEAVAQIIDQIVDHFDDVRGDSPIGVTIPGVVTHGVVRSAANIDKSWLDFDAEPMLEKVLGHDIVLVNDADAAGVAELYYGAAKGQKGLVVMTTLGTGIGTALIYNDVLIPNAELGHIEVDGKDAESQASYGAKERDDLDWKHWAKRLQKYYSTLEFLLSPDLFIVGGGVSKTADDFLPLLKLETPIVAAVHRNNAGILGAAALAAPIPAAEPAPQFSTDAR